MAEFCRDCWNKYNKNDPARNYMLSHGLELCEGCGEMKRIVLVRKHDRYIPESDPLTGLPFLFLDATCEIVCLLFSLPIQLYRYIQKRKKK